MNPEHTTSKSQEELLEQGFRPMRAVWEQEEPKTDDAALVNAGFSSNYRGEASERNASAQIPDDQNTSLWVTSMPAGCTYATLLGAVARHQPGKVFASHINPGGGRHRDASAKLVFFTRDAAEVLYAVAHSPRGFVVGGRRAKVDWNRIKTAAWTGPILSSRVLFVSGPAVVINRATLTELFRNNFVYDTEHVEEAVAGGEGTVVWYFGSFRAQSQSAQMVLNREYKGAVKAYFASDPCGL